MENVIDFQPGYYEWLVYVNGNCVYSFGDLTDEVPSPLTEENLEPVVDDLIEQMKYDFWTGELTISDEVKATLYESMEVLKDKMKKRIFYEWGAA